MYYCGKLKNTNVIEVFYSKIKPSEETHGNLYGFLFGGYKTKDKAFNTAKYQYNYNNIRFHDNRKKECKTNHNLYMILGIAV